MQEYMGSMNWTYWVIKKRQLKGSGEVVVRSGRSLRRDMGTVYIV